jgi:MFS superfamily sulfate permease-like transporter
MRLAKAYVALVLAEATSIPLLLLAALYILTGYQMLYPDELRLFPNPAALHTDKVLRIATTVLAMLHSSAGIVLLCERRIRNRLAREVIETIVLLLLITTCTTLLITDITR